MKWVNLFTLVLISAVFVGYAVVSSERLLTLPSAKKSQNVHTLRWGLEFSCPKKIYAGTAKLAKPVNEKAKESRFTACCYADGSIEKMKKKNAVCRSKH